MAGGYHVDKIIRFHGPPRAADWQSPPFALARIRPSTTTMWDRCFRIIKLRGHSSRLGLIATVSVIARIVIAGPGHSRGLASGGENYSVAYYFRYPFYSTAKCLGLVPESRYGCTHEKRASREGFSRGSGAHNADSRMKSRVRLTGKAKGTLNNGTERAGRGKAGGKRRGIRA